MAPVSADYTSASIPALNTPSADIHVQQQRQNPAPRCQIPRSGPTVRNEAAEMGPLRAQTLSATAFCRKP